MNQAFAEIRRIVLLAAFPISLALASYGAEQPTVRIEPSDSAGPCRIADRTKAAVVRNYLEAWQSMATALEQNSPTPLDAAFVGVAKDKIMGTVRQQQALGIQTHYRDQSHDLKVVFCSPEGLSVELTDAVEYEVAVLDQNQPQPARQVHAHYVAVLTPAETRWKVRMFQAEALESK